jgi:putative phosphoribosyl transferase
MIFANRSDAGRRLAERLEERSTHADVVLALPRGGVPVGSEVAARLGLSLDVFVVRKLRLPGHPDVAMGAVGSGGALVLNPGVVFGLDVAADVMQTAIARERREIARRERLHRGGRAPCAIEDKAVLLVDDGMATGASMRAAVEAVRRRRPSRVIVGVPVAAPEACDSLRRLADDVVCVATPWPFYSLGLWYGEFPVVTDAEVRRLLAASPCSRLAA